MVNINANYNAYVDFYNKHKDEVEKTGTITPDKETVLVVDITQIYNLMKNEGANAVIAVLEQLKSQGVAIDGPHIDLKSGTLTFKIGNTNYELNIAENETVSTPRGFNPNYRNNLVPDIRTGSQRFNGFGLQITPYPGYTGKPDVIVSGDKTMLETDADYESAIDEALTYWINDIASNSEDWGFDPAITEKELEKLRNDIRNIPDPILVVKQQKLDADGIKAWAKEQCQTAVQVLLEARVAASAPDATGDFDSYTKLRNFIFGSEARKILKEKGLTEYPQGYIYEQLADIVSNKHKDDWQSVTKEVLIEEFIAEFKAKGGTVTVATNDFKSVRGLKSYLLGNDAKSILKEKGVETFPEGYDYKDIVEIVCKKHLTDWQSVTKEALIEEFIAEFKAKGGKLASETPATGDSTSDIDYSTFVQSIPHVKTAINETIENKLDNIADGVTNIRTEFGVDKDGNIIFQSSTTKTIYDKLAKSIKEEISRYERQNGITDVLNALGGDATLNSLIQAAWMTTYNDFNSSTSHNTEKFVKAVLENLNKILDKLQTNPELLEVFTTRGCYGDSTITKGVTHYGTKTTYGNDEIINYKGEVTEHEDGTVHINNTKDDNDYQVTMKEILANIKAKYPNIDEKFLEAIFREAQKLALKIAQENRNDCPNGTSKGSDVGNTALNWIGNDRDGDGYKIHMDQLVQLTLYCFDKLFLENCITSEVPPRKAADKTSETTPEEPKGSSTTTNPNFKDAANDTIYALDYIIEEYINDIAGGNKSIHTEFGIDKYGKIVFQEKDTQKVYDNLKKYIKDEIAQFKTKNILADLGGEAVLDALIQAAWISAYNRFNSSQKNNTEAFLKEVIQNLQEILRAIQAHPERLDLYMLHTSYADSSLTDKLKHYNTETTHGDDETISYKGDPVVYSDGSVHLDNSIDDVDYQATMSELLSRLQTKYAAYGDITEIFRQAQLQALQAAKSNAKDCPYGTGMGKSRVEDSTLNWTGLDSRSLDSSKIHMDQLVQLTLYFFDKLFYQALAKA